MVFVFDETVVPIVISILKNFFLNIEQNERIIIILSVISFLKNYAF